jgi:hypothetical protein
VSQLGDIRTRLAANGLTCTGIKEAYAKVPGSISSAPALMVRPVNLRIGVTFEDVNTYLMAVRVVVPVGDLDDAQDTLDALLETSGAGSVIVALESDIDLNGEAHSVRVIEVEEYGIEDWGGTEMLGATVNVEVYA